MTRLTNPEWLKIWWVGYFRFIYIFFLYYYHAEHMGNHGSICLRWYKWTKAQRFLMFFYKVWLIHELSRKDPCLHGHGVYGNEMSVCLFVLFCFPFFFFFDLSVLTLGLMRSISKQGCQLGSVAHVTWGSRASVGVVKRVQKVSTRCTVTWVISKYIASALIWQNELSE